MLQHVTNKLSTWPCSFHAFRWRCTKQRPFYHPISETMTTLSENASPLVSKSPAAGAIARPPVPLHREKRMNFGLELATEPQYKMHGLRLGIGLLPRPSPPHPSVKGKKLKLGFQESEWT
jgi:hypothetical protein